MQQPSLPAVSGSSEGSWQSLAAPPAPLDRGAAGAHSGQRRGTLQPTVSPGRGKRSRAWGLWGVREGSPPWSSLPRPVRARKWPGAPLEDTERWPVLYTCAPATRVAPDRAAHKSFSSTATERGLRHMQHHREPSEGDRRRGHWQRHSPWHCPVAEWCQAQVRAGSSSQSRIGAS